MAELSKAINEHLEPMRLALERIAESSRQLGTAVSRWLASPEGQRLVATFGPLRDEKRKRIRRESRMLHRP